MGEYLARTYALAGSSGGELAVRGYVDGLAALQQAVFLLLQTESGRYPIFSAGYGVALQELLGQPRAYVVPEVERRLCEALAADERVIELADFVFEFDGPRLAVSFVVRSIYGEFAAKFATDVATGFTTDFMIETEVSV